MGRTPAMPEVIEKELVENPVEVEVTPQQAQDMGLIQKPPKKARTEKQMEATKKLIEKNKAWREKLKKEKAEGKSDNLVQGLLAEKADENKDEPAKTRIRYRIKKPKVHPRPNHALKRKAPPLPEDSDVGATTEAGESGVDTDAVVNELKHRVFGGLQPKKRFVTTGFSH